MNPCRFGDHTICRCLKNAAVSPDVSLEATKAVRVKVRGWKHSIMGDLVGQGSFLCTAANALVAAITDCTAIKGTVFMHGSSSILKISTLCYMIVS